MTLTAEVQAFSRGFRHGVITGIVRAKPIPFVLTAQAIDCQRQKQKRANKAFLLSMQTRVKLSSMVDFTNPPAMTGTEVNELLNHIREKLVAGGPDPIEIFDREAADFIQWSTQHVD
jgi:hypothetical protein